MDEELCGVVDAFRREYLQAPPGSRQCMVRTARERCPGAAEFMLRGEGVCAACLPAAVRAACRFGETACVETLP